ncbi:hypothetical protein PUG81_05025 [Erwiniaceae bacterium L1_54_6]|nr:hypothetical protein [Erwiniaceae bacterium L1_54_6]
MAGLTKEQRAQREAAKMADVNSQEQKQDEVKLVDMVRDEKNYPAPHTATVHPEEVVNYQLGGWVVKPAEKSE